MFCEILKKRIKIGDTLKLDDKADNNILFYFTKSYIEGFRGISEEYNYINSSFGYGECISFDRLYVSAFIPEYERTGKAYSSY